MEKEWKEWQHIRVRANTLLVQGPLLIKHVSLSATIIGTAKVYLYNGQDTNANVEIFLTAPLSATTIETFEIPVLFTKGLYVVLGEGFISCFIQYKIINR